MELFGEYFYATVGIALALFFIINIALMAAPEDENIDGWTDNKELWTAKAIVIGVPYCFLISAIAVIVYVALGALGAVWWVQVVSGGAALIAAFAIFGRIFGRRRAARRNSFE